MASRAPAHWIETRSGCAPLTGTTSMAHMRDDLDVLDFALHADEVDNMRRLFES